MKTIITLFLFCFLNSIVNAHEIKCYSYGHLKYSRHNITDLAYSDYGLIFTDTSTGKTVFTNLDCIVKIAE